MANNIKAAPNAVVAKSTTLFSAISAINVDNIAIIFLVDDLLKSYVPGRSINAITGFEAGKGYYIVAKVAIDLSAYLMAPLPMTLGSVPDENLSVGSEINLAIAITNGVAPFTISWFKNGLLLGSPTSTSDPSAIKDIPNAQSGDSGYYSALVSDINGVNVYSNFGHVVIS